jgi:hypothetical protein
MRSPSVFTQRGRAVSKSYDEIYRGLVVCVNEILLLCTTLRTILSSSQLALHFLGYWLFFIAN